MKPQVILTFDDTVKNHFTFVAPLLKKLGFGATFFVTFFNKAWQEKNLDTLMTLSEIAGLDRMGFEIGNHTLAHDNLCKLDGERIAFQIDELNRLLLEAGVARPTSFAYPGGPVCDAAIPLLKERGFLRARSVQNLPYDPAEFDLFRLPAYPVTDKVPENFEKVLEDLNPEHPVILCYHGVPDRVHPWVNTEEENFTRQMNLLREKDAEVRSLRDYFSNPVPA